MEPLNRHTLNKALGFAAEHEFTSIAIVLDIPSSVAAMRRSLVAQHLNLSECTCTRDRITFSNGSSIRLYDAGSEGRMRGHRSNIVLIHALITDAQAISRIEIMENPQHGHPGRIYKYVDAFRDYRDLIIDEVAFDSQKATYYAQDFGDLEPSSEILEYLGGLCG